MMPGAAAVGVADMVSKLRSCGAPDARSSSAKRRLRSPGTLVAASGERSTPCLPPYHAETILFIFLLTNE